MHPLVDVFGADEHVGGQRAKRLGVRPHAGDDLRRRFVVAGAATVGCRQPDGAVAADFVVVYAEPWFQVGAHLLGDFLLGFVRVM